MKPTKSKDNHEPHDDQAMLIMRALKKYQIDLSNRMTSYKGPLTLRMLYH